MTQRARGSGLAMIAVAGLSASALAQVAAPEPEAPIVDKVEHYARVAGRSVLAWARSAEAAVRRAPGEVSDWAHRKGAEAHRPRGLSLFTPVPPNGHTSTETPGRFSDWTTITGTETKLPSRVVLLVHGLDEEGDIWNETAPALREAGHTVVRFDYPNDQPCAHSAGLLADALRDLACRGVTHTDLVCHSMGGLLARDVLTRPSAYAGDGSAHAGLPAAERVIMIATPHQGATMAHLRPLGEVREQIVRWYKDDFDARQLLGFLADGSGEAARDLLPGSDYLCDLNGRPLPRCTALTCIVGEIRPSDEQYPRILTTRNLVTRVIGEDRGKSAASVLQRTARGMGDGVVSVRSQTLEGADTVMVCASHRGMLRASGIERLVLNQERAEAAPAIPVIVERLARTPAGAQPGDGSSLPGGTR